MPPRPRPKQVIHHTPLRDPLGKHHIVIPRLPIQDDMVEEVDQRIAMLGVARDIVRRKISELVVMFVPQNRTQGLVTQGLIKHVEEIFVPGNRLLGLRHGSAVADCIAVLLLLVLVWWWW